jgi:hypothetical protein
MAKKLKPFEKLITVMISGKPVTVEEIETTLGNEIHMYRLSTYIWHIKEFAGGVVKVIKDGRKVAAYQIMNVKEVQTYLKNQNIDTSAFVPGQVSKIVRTGRKTVAQAKQPKVVVPKVQKLNDLGAEPLPQASVKEEEIEVTEITDSDSE